MTPVIVAAALSLLLGPVTSGAPSEPGPAARHARALAHQASALGPETSAGRRCATEASRWALRALGSLLAEESPAEEDTALVQSALEACDAAIGDYRSLDALPYYRQSHDSYCVLASARMMLAAWEVRVSERELLGWAGPSAEEGVHVSSLLEWLSWKGISGFACEGDARLVRVALAAGCPVAVFQLVSLERDTPHMRVVAGFDRRDPEHVAWRILEPAPQLPAISWSDAATFDALWDLAWDEDGHRRWMCVGYDIEDREHARGG